jgi:1,4-dihydroxy-2-naphthoyl-CoA hydrolase
MTIWHGKIDLDRLNAMNVTSMAGHLGIEFVDYGDDWVKARMPVDERTMQPYGRLHGGASVALAETIASVAGAMTLDPEQFAAVGMEINANHIRPAGPGHVHAIARPEARGKSTQVWSIRIEDGEGRLVCVSRMTVAVIPAPRGAVG